MNISTNYQTFPLPGETQWVPGMDIETARKIAEHFYSPEDVIPLDGNFLHVFAVIAGGGFSAIVGNVKGCGPAILHKNPDGSRTLDVLTIALPTQIGGAL